jgi:uncharacterized membrane protein YeaQ/YmgE (transglycosylase-associated protein family)
MIQKIFNYLYKTENGRNLLHVIIGGFIALGCVLNFEMEGYYPLYVILLVAFIGLVWETYFWLFKKAVFDKGDILRAVLGAIIVLFINSLI